MYLHSEGEAFVAALRGDEQLLHRVKNKSMRKQNVWPVMEPLWPAMEPLWTPMNHLWIPPMDLHRGKGRAGGDEGVQKA